MKSIFKNNIFTDPQGWAQQAVGTPLRYRLSQTGSVVVGTFALVAIIFVSKISEMVHLSPSYYLAVGVPVFVITIELPLCCFRALRCYVVQSQSKAADGKK
jgi:hypothetical protein